jgi:membrane protein DedA with SNARE-associated domain
LSIFLWLFLTGIGIPPCPEEAGIIYAAGVTALHPEVRWWLAWPATSLGIVCADMALYGIGHHWGRHLFDFRWVQRIIRPERRQRIEKQFHLHGRKILLTARLLPPLRTGVFIIAGAIHYPFLHFLMADALYAVFGVGVFFFGSTWLIHLISLAGHWLVYPVVVFGGGYALYRYYRHLRQHEAKSDAPPPVSVLELPLDPPPEDKPAAPSPSQDRISSSSPE